MKTSIERFNGRGNVALILKGTFGGRLIQTIRYLKWAGEQFGEIT